MRLYSNNLLGDTLLQTPGIRSWKKANPDSSITYFCSSEHGSGVLLEGNPYIGRVIEDRVKLMDSEDDPLIQMDAAVAFNLGASNGKSLAWGYGQMLGVEIDSLKYDLFITTEEDYWATNKLFELSNEGAKPIVLIARHSASCTSNDPNIKVANKCVANRIWVQVANWLLREGFMPVAIGSSKDAQDSRYREWPGNLLYGEGIRNIAALTSMVKGVLTVDNGIRHIAAAAGANMFCISGRIPLSLISCAPVEEFQKIEEVYRELPHVNSRVIVEGARKIL